MTILTKLLTPSSRPASRPAASKRTGSNAYQAVAEAVGTLRKYQDVPVRFRRQWITAFLAGTILIGIVASLWLSVVSRAAITGREIQGLQSDITANQRTNADLETRIALLRSNESLQSRAIAAGYTILEKANLEYIVVPDYYPVQGVTLVVPSPAGEDVTTSPEYTESLFSWLGRQLDAASLPLAQDH